ncbi:MAG: zeta toxin family protein [Gammaproteobacteria bacterium]|nr:zeta toxin family protein [Gammaproteobacteria bacterium]
METTDIKIVGYQQLKKLRIALAIFQGVKLHNLLKQESEETVSHDQGKRVTYLTELFTRIHRDIFRDWKEQATAPHRPGTMVDVHKRKLFRESIEALVLEGDLNGDSALFDNNGFIIKTDNISSRLADFYFTMRTIRPFAYGNRLTLDFFMTTLGNLPAFKAVYEEGIDFRRLAPEDASKLHDSGSSVEQIATVFDHARDPGRNKSLLNIPNSYGKWPENKKYIFGIPFLSHKTEHGIECLVTVNGGLVPIKKIHVDLFMAGKNMADYPLIGNNDTIGYLPGTDPLRAADVNEIDGITIGAQGEAPLFCLDVNMLTGLRAPSHTELTELIKSFAGAQADIFDLADNTWLKSKLMLAAGQDQKLKRSIEIAFERLHKMINKLEQETLDLFKDKTVDSSPRLFMSMGGAGAGKTAVEEMATAQCGDNYVIASLDEFRKKSDLYTVLTAANHHSDDYMYVEPFAKKLRQQVARYARTHHYNILYDGTGIPYAPRYVGIINRFKDAGFKTQITAIDAFLVKPEGREDELPRSAVLESVKTRFQQSKRALPWVVTVDKHIRAPGSFFSALEHNALDKISLFANDGAKDKHYLVAESFDVDDDLVTTLQQQQLNGSLTACLMSLISQRVDSVLNMLAAGNQNMFDSLLTRNPFFREENVAYQVYSSEKGTRILAIYNVRRMVDFVEKRQLNPYASGEEGLLHSPDSLAFHVDPLALRPWMTRLQDSAIEKI